MMSDQNTQSDLDVRKIAHLARLELREDNIGPLTKDLESILDYAKMLNTLELGSVSPLSHAADLDSPLAPDQASGEIAHDDLLRIAPAMDGRFIEVPKVLGEGDGA